ncbi:coiled-coil domain-containing protein 96-like isoform X2 [Xenia sp. Carnegie-2017]|uniref:coiled-coil domain-containing protein 96-like isoform X2 n=1 Tax=Xenia sp. Carnegie-2017 TaxID=2897299 RepID=UPI001F0404FA|nr:coiled-coil domain-containing protein 96-like isoform X2 [Xenia sp. Carnegie-2017]
MMADTTNVLEENNSENPDVTNERLATSRPSISIEDVDFADNALSSNVEEIKTEENEQEVVDDSTKPTESTDVLSLKQNEEENETPSANEIQQEEEEEPSNEKPAELEKEDGPPLETITQNLSREGSVVLSQTPLAQDMTEVLDAGGTPPPVIVMSEDDTTDNIDNAPQIVDPSQLNEETVSIASSVEVPVYNRAELFEKYQQAVEERAALQTLNVQLQHKLAEYFKKKKTDDRQQEVEKNVNDQEQRYIKYLANLDELQDELSQVQKSYIEQIEEAKDKCSEKQAKVEEIRNQFGKHKIDIAKQALNSRSCRPIPPKDIEQYHQLEQKKEHEVMLVRLENIKLKNRLKKREMQLKAKEELAEGLHLIDFEQLKIENQTYNEKIEERNEELLKLRKKITTTVQVLTHLKEKLQFVQGENIEQRYKLKTVDACVAQKRDILTRTKQARDALRIDNVKLRQKCGLLGNEPLLRDYEERRDESIILQKQVENLKLKHAELTMNANGVKKKIEEIRILHS